MTSSDNSDTFLTPVELADLIKVPVATIYAWNSRGGGPPAHKIGRHLRYKSTEVETWVAEKGVPRREPIMDEDDHSFSGIDMAVYEPMAITLGQMDKQVPLHPLIMEGRRILGIRHQEELMAITLQIAQEAPASQCRKCGKPVMEIADIWHHTNKDGDRGCRSATWNCDTGYDESVPKSWKAEPAKGWVDPRGIALDDG
jgi:excisionase family DNA binding protein